MFKSPPPTIHYSFHMAIENNICIEYDTSRFHSFIENQKVGNKSVCEMTYMSDHLQFIVKPLNYLNELNIYIVHTS